MNDIKFEQIPAYSLTEMQKENIKFEQKKNLKATLYTIAVLCLLFLSLAFTKWEKPQPELPLKEDLIQINLNEINLGNDLNGGEGKIQPLVKGDFSPPDAGNPAPKNNIANEIKEEPADPETNEKDNEDAAAEPKPIYKPKNPSTHISEKTAATKPTVTHKQTQVTNAPPAPKPKIGGAWKRPGGTGSGNGSNVDNGFHNQGNGRGTGDQGNQFGTPSGTGQRLSNANLRNTSEIERLTSQSGTNYKGKVALVLRVDDSGNVTSVISASPSPASREAKTFAQTVAYKMRFPAGADGRTARITLDFDF